MTIDKAPLWTLGTPAVAAGLTLLVTLSPSTGAADILLTALVGAVLVATILTAVHHAEVVALRIGEPYGSLVLALAVTIIEVALIVTMMLSAKSGGEVIARDAVFAAVMIALNFVVGLCILAGASRHREQGFVQFGVSGLVARGLLEQPDDEAAVLRAALAMRFAGAATALAGTANSRGTARGAGGASSPPRASSPSRVAPASCPIAWPRPRWSA